jgi:hypothetical protein
MSEKIVITPGPVNFVLNPYIKYIPDDILNYVKKILDKKQSKIYSEKKKQPQEKNKINLYIIFDLYEKMRNKLIFIIDKLNLIVFDDKILKGFSNIDINELTSVPDLRNYDYILPNNEKTNELTILILNRINIMGQHIDNITTLLSQIKNESLKDFNEKLNKIFESTNQYGGMPINDVSNISINESYTGKTLKGASEKLDKILSFVQSLNISKLGTIKMNPIEKKYTNNNSNHMYDDFLFQFEQNVPIEKQIKQLTNINNNDDTITQLYLNNINTKSNENISIKLNMNDIQYEVDPLLSTWGNDIGNILKQFTIIENDINKNIAIDTYSTIKSIINFINYDFSNNDFILSKKDTLEETIKSKLEKIGNIQQLQEEYDTIKSEQENISKIYPLEKEMNNQIDKLNFNFNKWNDEQQFEIKKSKNNIIKIEKKINELIKEKKYYIDIFKNDNNQEIIEKIENEINLENSNITSLQKIYKNELDKYNNERNKKKDDLINIINNIMSDYNQKSGIILGSNAKQKIEKIEEIKKERKKIIDELKISVWNNIFNKSKIIDLTTNIQKYINNINSDNIKIINEKNRLINNDKIEKNKIKLSKIDNIIEQYEKNIIIIETLNKNLDFQKISEKQKLIKADENQKHINTYKQIILFLYNTYLDNENQSNNETLNEIIKNELFGKTFGQIKMFINEYSKKTIDDIITNMINKQNKFKCNKLLNYNAYGIPNIKGKQLYIYNTLNNCFEIGLPEDIEKDIKPILAHIEKLIINDNYFNKNKYNKIKQDMLNITNINKYDDYVRNNKKDSITIGIGETKKIIQNIIGEEKFINELNLLNTQIIELPSYLKYKKNDKINENNLEQSEDDFNVIQKLNELTYSETIFDKNLPQGVIKNFFDDNFKNISTDQIINLFNGQIKFDELIKNIENIDVKTSNIEFYKILGKLNNTEKSLFIDNIKKGIKKKITEIKKQYNELVKENKNNNIEQIKINITKKFLEIIKENKYNEFKIFYDTISDDFIIPDKDDDTPLFEIYNKIINKIENNIIENKNKITNITQNIEKLKSSKTLSEKSSIKMIYNNNQQIISDKKWFTDYFIYKEQIKIDESILPKDYLKMNGGNQTIKYYSDTTFLNSRIYDIMFNLNNSEKIMNKEYNKLLLEETINKYNECILIYIYYVLNMCDIIPKSFIPKYILSIDDVNDILISIRKAMKSDLYKNNEDLLKIVFGRTERCYNKMALLLNKDTTQYIDVIKSNSIIDILIGNHIMSRVK